MRRVGLMGFLAGVVAGAGALAVSTSELSGLSGPEVARAQSAQATSGQQVYRQFCAMCHGDAGEGVDDAPPLIGSGNQLADYRTAARVYSFTASEMPGDEPGSLTSQQYYDVVAYL